MSSEVETSREDTLKVPQRDSSTSLGMTRAALIQMRYGPVPEKNFAAGRIRWFAAVVMSSEVETSLNI